jgi:Ca2+-binding EF-hand superfamily protein
MKRVVKETDVYIKNNDGSVSTKRVMATVITIKSEDLTTEEELQELIKGRF